MSNKEFEKFIKKLRMSVEELRKLSDEEKEAMRGEVFRYVENNPPITEEFNKGYRQFKYSLWTRMAIPALAIIIVFGGVGVSTAAEGAIPGDLLYPIKVGLNEKVRETLAFSDEAKEDWKFEQLERRFEEADILASNGTVEERRKEMLEREINKNIEELEIVASKLEEKGLQDGVKEIYFGLSNLMKVNAKFLTEKDDLDGASIALSSREDASPSRDSNEKEDQDVGDGLGGDGEVGSTAMLSIEAEDNNRDEKQRNGKKLKITIKNRGRIAARTRILEAEDIIEEINSNLTQGERVEELAEMITDMKKSYAENDFDSVLKIYENMEDIIRRIEERESIKNRKPSLFQDEDNGNESNYKEGGISLPVKSLHLINKGN